MKTQQLKHQARHATNDTTNAAKQTDAESLLRRRAEELSGYSLDDVTIHYNSDQPARHGALAYARGNQVHLGPGQEQHLGHELWHVVQQKQGRVLPTVRVQGLNINADPALEREADVFQGVLDDGMKRILKTAEDNNTHFPVWVSDMLRELDASEAVQVVFENGAGGIHTRFETGGVLFIHFLESDLNKSVAEYDRDPKAHSTYLSYIVHEITHAYDYLKKTPYGKPEHTGRKITTTIESMLLAEMNAWKNEAISGVELAFINEPRDKFRLSNYDTELFDGFRTLTATPSPGNYVYERLRNYFHKFRDKYGVPKETDRETWLAQFLADNWAFIRGLAAEVIELRTFIDNQSRPQARPQASSSSGV